METYELIRRTIFVSAVLLHYCMPAQQLSDHQRYWTFGFNVGGLGIAPVKYHSAWGNGFTRTGSAFIRKNGRGGTVLAGTKSLGLHAGLLWPGKTGKSLASLQFEFQQNRNTYAFDLPFQKKVPKYSSSHNTQSSASDSTLAATGKWTESDLYLKGSVSFQYMYYLSDRSCFLRGDKYIYLKMSFGQTFLHRNQGNIVRVGQADNGTDDYDNLTTARTVSANPNAFMLGAEIGLHSFTIRNNRSLDIGLSWQIPLAASFTRQYEFTQMVPKQGPLHSGGESINFTGSSVLLNVTYSFMKKQKHTPSDTNPYENMAPQGTPLAHISMPRHMNGRRVKLDGKVEAADSLVAVSVWDKGKIDGDIISLYLNGIEVLHNFTVSRTKKNLMLRLRPGKNYLVMHALNLGRIPPNTAVVEIGHSQGNKRVLLSSDMGTSGAVEVAYNTPKVQLPTKDTAVVASNVPSFIARGVKLRERITVHDSIITGNLWDYAKEDGDMISLYLNGKEVLSDFVVKNKKDTIELPLKPGKNYLVIQGRNSGVSAPNTAAIGIWNADHESRQLSLGFFREVTAMEINYVPRQ